jgi:hypothetical protein
VLKYVLVEDDPQERLRRICLALPEVTERLSHGEPTWFVRGRKTFVSYADHHHDDRLAFWCAAPPGAQEALVAENPAAFFVPPYVGGRGWIGVRLDVPVDWTAVTELVQDAYRVIAPRSLVAGLGDPGARAGEAGQR